jgi:signal transduction histidine kinase
VGDVPPAPAVVTALASSEPFTALQTRRLGPIRRWFAEHPRGTDIVVMAWFALPSMTNLAWPMPRPGAHLALVAVTTAVLWFRRRYPVHVLAWTLAAAAISSAVISNTGGHEWAAAMAVYAVASLRPTRTAWIAAGVTVLTLAAIAWLTLDYYVAAVEIEAAPDQPGAPATPLQAFVALTSWMTVITLVALSIGTNVRARRLHTKDLVDRANRLVLERDQREQLATAAERARIAREMHDVVAHSVSVMVALADGAAASLEKRPERTRAALAELSLTGRDALTEIRSILGVLRTERAEGTAAPFDGDAPLAPTTGDLDELLARFRAAGLPVERIDSGPPLPQQPRFALTVYRVVQEALTNVLRYAAGASRVVVEIDRTDDVVSLVISNDAGTGTVQPGSGHGLVGLRERVAGFGGTVTAGPHAGGGWRVHATIPVPTEPT